MYPKLFLSSLLILFSFQVNAQSYFTTGGIRLGSDYGLSFKQRILKKTTFEAILSSEENINSNVGLTLLYDKHKAILTRNFNLFYGTGLAWRWNTFNDEIGIQKSTNFGIPVQAGVEITVGRINLSWDYTPILYISSNSNAFTSSKGLTVRYVFVNKKEGKRIMKKIKSPFTKHKK